MQASPAASEMFEWAEKDQGGNIPRPVDKSAKTATDKQRIFSKMSAITSKQICQEAAEPNPWGRYDAGARGRGWPAILVEEGGKVPVGREWQKRGVPTAAEVARWASRTAANMGLRLGDHPRLGRGHSVVAFDMDVLNPVASSAVLALVRRHAPGAPLRRGDPAKPGSAFIVVVHPEQSHPCLQQGDAFRFADTPADKVERVEVLGRGRQSVIHGTHPCGDPFTWDGDRSILEVPVEDLPKITLDELEALVSACNAALEAAGGVRCGRGSRQSGGAEEGRSADLTPLPERFAKELLAGLKATKNDLHRPTWVQFSKAIHRLCKDAVGDEAVHEALAEFHERYEGYDDPDELSRVLSEE